MMIAIDHVAIPARDPEASSRFLADILGLRPATRVGPDGEMRLLAVGDSGALLYNPAVTVVGQHVAFGVDEATFARVVDRLRTRQIAFGNDPEEPANMQTADPLGGQGRVYFSDPDGHLFEVLG
jgi:catechol 2,3-dioxygenase-like lactoylglutathione lyase family enzyme